MAKKNLLYTIIFFSLVLLNLKPCYAYPAFCCYCRDVAVKSLSMFSWDTPNNYCSDLYENSYITFEASEICGNVTANCSDCGEMWTNPNSKAVTKICDRAPTLSSYY